MKQDPERKQSVSVEDLLRLKRAEQPRDEFWSGWQAQMRSKLVVASKQQPSWISRTLPQVWIAVARWHLPVGAAALVALGYIAVREFNPPVPALSAPSSVAVAQHAVAPDEASSSLGLMSELRQAEHAPALPNFERRVTNSLALLGVDGAARQVESRTAVAIAANLAQVRSQNPEIIEVPYTLHGKSPLVAAEEPLARAAVNHNSRRERLLGFHQPAPAQATPRANLAAPSRLNEDRLTENAVRRLEARGDMFSLRF